MYAKTTFYDNVDDQTLDIYYWRSGTYLDAAATQPATGLKNIGSTELENYAETKIGLQVMFQF